MLRVSDGQWDTKKSFKISGDVGDRFRFNW